MDWAILDGFDSENGVTDHIGSVLRSRLDQKGKRHAFFKLKDMDIAPCRSCGACSFKSPGKCVVNDDMHGILRAIASSSVVVLLTLVRFGGYSAQLKKATDKFMVLGMPTYIVRKGHMLHPMRYGDKSLIVIGVLAANLTGQEEAFRLLVERNALNILAPHHKVLFVKPSDTKTGMGERISHVLEEALQW